MMRRGRIEMDGEPVTDKVKAKLAAISDREIKRLFDDLFPLPDLDEWRATSWPPHGVIVNGA